MRERDAPFGRLLAGAGLYFRHTDGQGAGVVTVYLDVAVLLNFLIDFLLLLGTNRLAGYPPGAGRAALAAALGSVYAGCCLLPGFRFLGNLLWRLVSLGLMSTIAFGWKKTALRRGILFVFLRMALGGVALGIGSGGLFALVAAAAGVSLLCLLGFRGKAGGSSYVPVELQYAGKRLRLTGLQDTGNTLRDPVTGQQVLVAGAEVAEELTGLTAQQLQTPVETLASAALPGLRLIPYRAVGQKGGMLLAMRLTDVKVGSWRGSSIVAFAPEGLGKDGAYQVLTGGAI